MSKKSKKLEAPKGHPKYERKKPEPDIIIEYCSFCDSKLGPPIETKIMLEEEIPEPQPIRVTGHKINIFYIRSSSEITRKSPIAIIVL